jgi:hypothetical protein
MKKLFLFICFLSAGFNEVNLHAQIPDWQWAWKFGGQRFDEIQQSYLDSDDNIYVSGYTKSTAVVLGGQTYNASNMVPMSFVAKFSPSGQLLWHFPFAGNVQSAFIMCLIDGQPLVFASYYGTVNIGGFTFTYNGSGNQSLWIRFNANGGIISVSEPEILNNSVTHISHVVPDNQNRLVFVGYSQNECIVNDFTIEANKKYIGHLSHSGELLSSHYLGGEGSYDASVDLTLGVIEYLDLAVAPSGAIYLGGVVSKHATSDSSTWILPELDYTNQLYWGREPFVARFDSELNFEWAKVGDIQANGPNVTGHCRFRGFHVFPDESVVFGLDVSLDEYSYIVFDSLQNPNPSIGMEDAHVVKLLADGSAQWIRQFDNPFGTGNFIGSVSGDLLGNSYFSNIYNQYTNTDGSTYGNFLITKLSPDGDVVWFRGSDNGPATQMISRIYNLDLDSRGNVVLSGSFSCHNAPMPVFGPNVLVWTTPAPNEETYTADGFVAKLNTCPLLQVESSVESPIQFCAGDSINVQLTGSPMVQWSDGDSSLSKWVYNSDILRFIGYDSLGCYSAFDTIEVRENPTYQFESTVRLCLGDSVNIGGYTYSQAGLYTSNYTSLSGCDSTHITWIEIDTLNAEINLSGNVFNVVNPPMEASIQWLNCDNNFAPINGAINSDFTASTEGNYAVVINSENCRDTSDCIFFSTVGLNSLTSNLFRVYPIPADEILVIESELLNTPFRIFDAQGRLVFEAIKCTKRFDIAVSELKNGLYFIQSENRSHPFTIIHNH